MTSLISVIDYWYEDIDCSKINLTIILDLKKVFDTVEDSILMKKIAPVWDKRPNRNWFESYVANRMQLHSLNGIHSKPRNVTCGILRGSCLGPLLFIIYLNDFEKCLHLYEPISMLMIQL